MNKRFEPMAIGESSASQYTLQQVWLDGSARAAVVPAGWVRVHAATGAAAWTFGYLYCATGAVAVWAAWDAGAALNRFFLLLGSLLGSLLLVSLLARAGSEKRDAVVFRRFAWRLSGVMAGLAVLIALLVLLDRFSGATLTPILEQAPWLLPGANAVGGALALLAPYVLALTLMAWRVRSPWLLFLLAPVLLVVFAALIATMSRGAWLGLLAGIALAVYLNWRLTRRRGILGHLLDLMLTLAVLAAGAIWLAVAFNPAIGLQLGLNAAGGAGGSAASRVQLWQDTLPLLRDYWFTGSGLAPVAMVYATYSLLLHVPFLEHAHNLYLQVALEQGMVGLVALVGLILATLVRAPAAWGAADRTQRLLLAAGVASVTAMAVHGLFDAELYVSALAPLIFLAIVALQGSATLAGRTQRTRGQLAAGYRTDFRWLGMTVALLLALLPLARPHPRAAFAANLGAVAQSRAELTAYLRPFGAERPFLQDAIRRSQSALLAPAVSFFNAALESDPANSTAHRRLGQIALAQGNMTVASEHLQAVVAVQPGDRVARQLLGELAALQNRPAEAVSRWRTVDLGQDQLLVRQWWYEALENPTHVRLLAFAVAAYEEAMLPE